MNNSTLSNLSSASSSQGAFEQKAIAQVQGQIIMTMQRPRDQYRAREKILETCERPKFAAAALYEYPRGGKSVCGPSIELARLLARSWGNIDFGVFEVSRDQSKGESMMHAYAWDLETNTKETRQFIVKYQRRSRGRVENLEDPRDIYEHTANLGARRLRACILGIIPHDVIQDAVDKCNQAIANGLDGKSFKDKVKMLLDAFQEVQVKSKMIESYLNHSIDDVTVDECVQLKRIYEGLRSGMYKREDYFDTKSTKLQAIEDKLASQSEEKNAD